LVSLSAKEFGRRVLRQILLCSNKRMLRSLMLPGCAPGRKLGALVAAAVWLAACASDTGRKEASGPAIGAGAVSNRAAGAPIAAGSATPLGVHAGAKLDDEDKRRASVAELQALETGPSGAPVAWRNPETGRFGNVVHGPVYQENGVACREYTHTEHGTACRRSDGTWASIS
jgi:surface antigen